MSSRFRDDEKLAKEWAEREDVTPMRFIYEFGVEQCPCCLEDPDKLKNCLTYEEWKRIFDLFSRKFLLKKRKICMDVVEIEHQMLFIWHHIPEKHFQKIEQLINFFWLHAPEEKFKRGMNFPHDRTYKTRRARKQVARPSLCNVQ